MRRARVRTRSSLAWRPCELGHVDATLVVLDHQAEEERVSVGPSRRWRARRVTRGGQTRHGVVRRAHAHPRHDVARRRTAFVAPVLPATRP